MRLTDDQARAVRSWRRGDVCVVAGPGSGKTRVLVERVRWLILDREVEAERILAITFTEKAAHEMRQRLLAGEGGQEASEARSQVSGARISTIDAFCARLLKDNPLEAGVDPAFDVLDEAASATLLDGAIDRALAEAHSRGGGALRDFLDSYGTGPAHQARGHAFGLRVEIAAVVRRIRSHGCEPFLCEPEAPLAELADAVRSLAEAGAGPDDLAPRLEIAVGAGARALADAVRAAEAALKPVRKVGKAKPLVTRIKDDLLPACRAAAVSAANRTARRWLLDTVRRALVEFDAAKRASGGLDFDDVIQKATALLAAEGAPRQRFEHVLIDEFQDTNPIQVRFVDQLVEAHGERRPTRFAVGDINQSIYGFRHADQNVFRNYRGSVEESGGHLIRLSETFRSRPEVLQAVHRILPGGDDGGIEEHRLQSAFRFPPKAGPSCEVRIVCDAGERALEREAAWIADRLRGMREGLRLADRSARTEGATRAMRWSDAAILVRTHARAAQIAASLRRCGVPCRTGGGRSLFRSAETAELAAFLRVVRNPRDEISLAAVLKSPFCGIGDEDLLRLRAIFENLADALNAPSSAWELDAPSGSRLERFRALLDSCRTDRAITSVRLLLVHAVSACGYRSYLAGREDGLQALSNLNRLLEWIGRREAQGPAGVDAVSEELDRALELPPPEKGSFDKPTGADAVEVMTMHAAKGLEFPVVVLASLQAGGRGADSGLLFSEKHGLGARWREPFGDARSADSAFLRTRADTKRLEDEEADRLLYVALTRAEEHHLLSASFSRRPEQRGWCKALFQGFEIDPKVPAGESHEREAGDVRFTYGRTAEGPPDRAAEATSEESGLQVLTPLPPSAQADYIAAVTSVAEFAECPRNYFLSRYLGVEPSGGAARQASRPDGRRASRRRRGDSAQFGDLVHRHLAGQLDEAKPAVRRLAAKFGRHELGRRAAAAARVEKEMAFTFAVGSSLLRGTVDLLFEEGGERILLDYKTNRVTARGSPGAARRYAPQLQLYAAGLAKAGRPVDRAVVFFLRPSKAVDVDVGSGALESARGLVGEFFEAQRQQSYPLRVGRHCLACPHYGGACPARLA